MDEDKEADTTNTEPVLSELRKVEGEKKKEDKPGTCLIAKFPLQSQNFFLPTYSY